MGRRGRDVYSRPIPRWATTNRIVTLAEIITRK